MKILLTGATGFLGSNILRRLVKEKFDIIILKRSFSNVDKIKNLENFYKSYNIDQVSFESVFDKEKDIEVVIHCATNYSRNHEKSSEVLESNTKFPLKVLEYACNNGVKLFINTDTSLSKIGIIRGYMQDYILSKKQFLDWGRLYAETKKISFVNLVLEHVYGPGDDPSKFISYLIESINDNSESIDLTSGEQYRDFIFVEDVVDVYLTIIKKRNDLLGYSVFEVGSGNEVKIKDLVELIKKIMKSKVVLNFGAIKNRENEVMSSKANINSLLNLGWKPRYDLNKGLRKYISKYY